MTLAKLWNNNSHISKTGDESFLHNKIDISPLEFYQYDLKRSSKLYDNEAILSGKLVL